MSKPLNPRQMEFCRHYVESRNGTQAAIAAGYSKIAPAEQASVMLKNPKIQEQIKLLQDKLTERGLWSREQSVRALIDVINEPDRKSDVVSAVKELNLMHGFNEPVKTETQLSINFFADDANI